MTSNVASSNSAGVGQQDPFSSIDDWAVITFIARQLIALLDTMKPCKVVSVHPGTGSPPIAGTVDVQLLISQIDGGGNVAKQGIVYGIPFTRLQGGVWSIVMDPAIGDFGWVCAADRDISALKSAVAAGQSPTNVNPGSNRKYHVSDSVYVGGAFNPKVTKAWAWFKTDGAFEIQDQAGNVLKSDATAGFIMTPVSGGGLLVNGFIYATGEVIRGSGGSDSVTLGNHTHDQGNDSHGDTEVPTNAPNAGT